MNQYSEYSATLSKEDFRRYQEKLKLTTGKQLTDPYLLKDKWSDDIASLPEIAWRDVTEHLLDTPGMYTKESIKAYKSLEAYYYFVCGHVQNCYYHDIIRIKFLLHQISGTCYLNIDLAFTRGNFREYETWQNLGN